MAADFVAIGDMVLNLDAIAYARKEDDGSVSVYLQVERERRGEREGAGPELIVVRKDDGPALWTYLTTVKCKKVLHRP